MARTMTSRIKELLEQKGITQRKLSELTGITESAISHYIKGDRIPRGMSLVKIAQALGTTADDLVSCDQELDKERDLVYAKALIARNASQMTTEEKIGFIKLLMEAPETDET